MSKSLKNIGIVSALTAISRVLGLVRDQLSAAIFGTSVMNSAFITAFNLPNLFRRLLGEGSLTAAIVPTLQEELHESGRPGAYLLLSKVTSWLLVVTGTLVLLAMIAFSQSRLLPGHDEKWYLAADLTVILFPYLAFVCLAAAFNATLNVFQRFTEPALSPIWLNVTMIISLGGAGLHWADTDLGRMHWLCAGVLAGGFFQMAVPAAVLMHAGWRPRLDLVASPRLREIGRLMAPGLFGTAIYQINVFVSRLLAFSLNDSAASVLFYANRLVELPIGVFAIAVATVVYPLIAKHAVQRDFASMAEDYQKGMRVILVINVPAAAGLVLLNEPIVRLLFQRGAFTAEDTAHMAPLLALFALGMPFFSVVSLTTRSFYAMKDMLTPVIVAGISFLVNLGLSLLLMRSLEAAGLVLASTAAIVVQTIILQAWLEKRLPQLSFAPLWKSAWKIVAGTAVMGGIVVGGRHALKRVLPPGHVLDLSVVLGLIVVGAISYGIVLWVLRIEGREDFEKMLGRLRGKK
ncbi:murein biosynthesis integral membrane protein MurJ [Horticoccus luteus]|uniref:Probable lipid II flippase MurJ n=1 Tax=Horticoccus luteus TaxID=2862869 RepID=A0A8F9XH28_9BACT|nr:murein biosynthesis integral membrane protein MurJ [Horticoccus luteus]QYM79867.1 murein biosynthesis integral membrane protein MurJ [Horticoccus luteus]